MLIKTTPKIKAGETIFQRVRPKNRKAIHEGGNLHLERMYASGGMVVSIFHNYDTNQEEQRFHTVDTAFERYKQMADMRESSPEWVDEKLLPAILKAIRAAQLQNAEGDGLIRSVEPADPEEILVESDWEELERRIGDEIALARKTDPELDAEMKAVEAEAGVL